MEEKANHAGKAEYPDLLTRFSKIFPDGSDGRERTTTWTTQPTPAARSLSYSERLDASSKTSPRSSRREGPPATPDELLPNSEKSANGASEDAQVSDPRAEQKKRLNRKLVWIGVSLGLLTVGIVTAVVIMAWYRAQSQDAQKARSEQDEIERKAEYHEKNVQKVTGFVDRVNQLLSGKGFMFKSRKGNKSQNSNTPATGSDPQEPAYKQSHPGPAEGPAPWAPVSKADEKEKASGSAPETSPTQPSVDSLPPDLFVADP